MLTDNELVYYLDQHEITNNEYDNLVENYFQISKKHWDNEEKNIRNRKITQFWQLIRKYAMRRGEKEEKYNFVSFKFPDFEEKKHMYEPKNFWEKKVKKEFIYNTYFFGATFEKADFIDVVFCEAYFNDSTFLDAKFRDAKFQKAHFTGSKFHEANFAGATFQEARFIGSTFYDVYFGRSIFQNVSFANASFQKANFGGVTFQKASFRNASLRKVNFGEAIFNEIYFQGAQFHKADFSRVQFSGELPIVFDNVTCIKEVEDVQYELSLKFDDTRLPSTIVFRNVDMTNITFHKSHIVETDFKECDWGSYKRILMSNEGKILNKKEDKDVKALQETYRQLKRNFENVKNWDLSGRAYHSEMLISRKRLYLSFTRHWFRPFFLFNSAFWEWLIYWLYGRLSGFTESILTPLGILVVSIFVFAIGYSIYFSETFCFCSFDWGVINQSFQLSLAATLPIFDTELDYPNWYIKSFQTLLNTVLLTFFILSVRKRFK